ncbi:phage tail tape measure protein [Paracoccaceae bacterium GXU_MW_L88]
MQSKIAGVTAASFVSASYDIKSGISSLTDEGVADMTAAAVVTAKATKGIPEQMTSLFATSYGIFKKQNAQMSDADWGNMFGATLAKSVQQFKTDGAKMQQAIESAGAFASNLGMGLQEEMAVLGMMQTSMQAGEAGTALRAFAESSAGAHEAFQGLAKNSKNPIRVKILDDNGQLRAMPDILQDLKLRYGETLDGFESAEIKKAFGTTEALKLINALWGQEDAVRANVEALNEAASAGSEFTEQMAAAVDNNFAAKMDIIGQKWEVMRQKIGLRLVPIFDVLLPKIGAFLDRMSNWISAHPRLITGIGVVVAGVAALTGGIAVLALGLAPLIAGWATLRFSMTLFSVAFKAVGRMMLFNPIGLAVAAIAGGAYLIIRNWDAVSGFFRDLWSSIRNNAEGAWNSLRELLRFTPLGLIMPQWQTVATFFSSMWSGIRANAEGAWNGLRELLRFTPLGVIMPQWQGVTTFFTTVWDSIKLVNATGWEGVKEIVSGWPAFMREIGTQMLQGLMSGIKSKFGAVKEAIGGVGDGAKNWLKNRLGIRSPSRVFMALGGHISEGLAVGIQRREGLATARMEGLRRKLIGAGAAGGVALSGGMAAASPIESYLNASNNAVAAGGANREIVYQPTYNINIGAGVAGDHDQLEALIRRMLAEQAERDKADLRRLLHD